MCKFAQRGWAVYLPPTKTVRVHKRRAMHSCRPSRVRILRLCERTPLPRSPHSSWNNHAGILTNYCSSWVLGRTSHAGSFYDTVLYTTCAVQTCRVVEHKMHTAVWLCCINTHFSAMSEKVDEGFLAPKGKKQTTQLNANTQQYSKQ